jgi:UDP-N-acetylglucosamine transferase subunit ALG13
MILVTVGTHYMDFSRFLKRIDEIAPLVKEEIVVQRGHTKYIPKNCKSFDFVPSLDPYYKKASLVVMHGGSSVWEFMYESTKPIIIVPRQEKYKEHVNDHQVDFAEYMDKELGVKTIYEMSELTPELLNTYKKRISLKPNNLNSLKSFLKSEISKSCKKD